jgi:hypothetical protein
MEQNYWWFTNSADLVCVCRMVFYECLVFLMVNLMVLRSSQITRISSTLSFKLLLTRFQIEVTLFACLPERVKAYWSLLSNITVKHASFRRLRFFWCCSRKFSSTLSWTATFTYLSCTQKSVHISPFDSILRSKYVYTESSPEHVFL